MANGIYVAPNAIRAFGTGVPILDGAVVIPNASFTASIHADAAGVVYEVQFSRDPNGAWLPASYYMGFEAGVLWSRKTSVALCAAAPGSYYSAAPDPASGAATFYVHPFGSTNPISDGKLYEYTHYCAGIDRYDEDDLTIEGPMRVRRYCGAYGVVTAGEDAEISNLVLEYGGKHHSVIKSGRWRRTIAWGRDKTRSVMSDTGLIPFVGYKPDATGMYLIAEDCMDLMPPGEDDGRESLYSHGSTNDFTGTSTIRRYIGRGVGPVHPNTIGASIIEDVVKLDARAPAIQIPNRAPTYSLDRNLIRVTRTPASTIGAILLASAGGTAGATGELKNQGVILSVAGNHHCLQVSLGTVADIHHNVFYTVGNTAANVLANAASSGTQFRYNIVVIDATGSTNFVDIAAAASSDYNVYIATGGTHNWRSATVNYSTLAAFRAATGKDTNSVLLNTAQGDDLFLTGLAGAAAGDLRINPAYAGPNFVDSTPLVGNVGIQSYRDWNVGDTSTGQPYKLLTAPANLTECDDWVSDEDPDAWNYYPGGATRITLSSKNFTTWTQSGTSTSANATAAPDGTTTADQVSENSATSAHGVFAGNLNGSTNGQSQVASVYAKRNGRDVQITFNSIGFGTGQYANFDLANGVLGTVTGGTAWIEELSNGWCRCMFRATASATSATGSGFSVFMINSLSAGRAVSYLGGGSSGAYLWGAQLESNIATPGPYQHAA